MRTTGPLGTQPAPAAAAARWAESHAPLVERIRDAIERAPEGRIPFARFMQLALYEPGLGYYRRRSDRATRTGDFLTAPETDPIFGHALARQLEEMWQRLGRPEPFVLRDHGAGTGALGTSVLAGLRLDASPLAEALRYEPVESGPERRRAIEAAFAAAGLGEQLRWADPTTPFVGCLVANELLDALPVHRLARIAGRLVELHVTWRESWFADEPGPLSDERLEPALAASGLQLAEGECAEVSLAAIDWLQRVAPTLERGFLLIIDYGGPAAALHARMPAGTLRTYRGHHAGDDPYRAVGEQDLTAHVETGALERAAAEAGLTLLGRTTQAEFLAGLELGELLVSRRARPDVGEAGHRDARNAVLRFLDPQAMGRFAVLVFARGVAAEPPLLGLRFRLPASDPTPAPGGSP
ncbi:MAG TPA: SAM-dependent methyltransferase [Candidatus Limnocylindrales bacterium]|nr:SAM-dependent methyltransferase [Candidatus Limnocylindrales bacterium]